MKYSLKMHAAWLAAVLWCVSASFAANVSVVQRDDYVYGNYGGTFSSPPHADGNPQKAVEITWSNSPNKLVFAHEQSYCPFFELPSGAGVCYQFWEGNNGWAELFNNYGRMETNSYVQVLEQTPDRAHVRWTYYGVNMTAGTRAYMATEDFYAMSNGLVLRKQSYVSLMPGDHHGYAREPIELIGMAPKGQTWADVLQTNPETGQRHALAVLDAFSPNRYDDYWTPDGSVYGSTASRDGDASTWAALNDSAGVAMVLPLKGGSAFTIIGDASGFPHDVTRIKGHTYSDTGPEIWGSASWDHWPIGWLNSQTNFVNENTLRLYPNHFSPMGMDLFALPNETVEAGTYYSLIGVGGENSDEAIRSVAKAWLELGPSIGDPDSVARLPSVTTPEPSSLLLLGAGAVCGVACRAAKQVRRHVANTPGEKQ